MVRCEGRMSRTDVMDRCEGQTWREIRTWWTDVTNVHDGRKWRTDKRDGGMPHGRDRWTWRTDVTDGCDNAHCYVMYVCILFNEFTTSPRIYKNSTLPFFSQVLTISIHISTYFSEQKKIRSIGSGSGSWWIVRQKTMNSKQLKKMIFFPDTKSCS